MNDGRIMAADMEYYTNAGNTVDESVLVGSIMLFCKVLFSPSTRGLLHSFAQQPRISLVFPLFHSVCSQVEKAVIYIKREIVLEL